MRISLAQTTNCDCGYFVLAPLPRRRILETENDAESVLQRRDGG
jgi:hypothetical protein